MNKKDTNTTEDKKELFVNLKNEYSDIKIRMYEVQCEMLKTMETFKGTIKEAILIGMVKPDFPVPPEYYRK